MDISICSIICCKYNIQSELTFEPVALGLSKGGEGGGGASFFLETDEGRVRPLPCFEMNSRGTNLNLTVHVKEHPPSPRVWRDRAA